MGKVIGIDLGTTNSVVAIADGPTARVLDSKENRPQTRSIVGLKMRSGKPDEILVGDIAFQNWPLAPRATIISIKRLMGRGVGDDDVQKVRAHFRYEVVEPADGTKDSVRVIMGGKPYSPEDISALILRKIKADAEYRLGGEPVTDAVITVPAFFSQAQKAATRRAGQMAGLRVIKILDEPTAAAIAFGMDQAASTEPKVICVYDLGGGTFDISVLMWAGNVFAPLNLEGDMWLGGDNFDLKLVGYALKHLEQECGMDPRLVEENDRFMAELQKAAQQAKENLSTSQSTEMILTGGLQNKSGDLVDLMCEVTREQFEELAQDLVEKSIKLVEKALEGAELTTDQVDHVLIAGNSSTIPMVQKALEKLFGADKLRHNIHPKNCVAVGAAMVAAVLRDRVVCQAPDPADAHRECGFINQLEAKVCEKCGAAFELAAKLIKSNEVIIGGIAPFAYGVQLAGDKFGVFVKKNDPYPTAPESRRPQLCSTRKANQRIAHLPIYGGDNLDRASANTKQGDVYALLPPGLPNGTKVRVTVWLDSDGVFKIDARLEDGTNLHIVESKGEADARALEALIQADEHIEKGAKELSPQQLAEAERLRERAFEAVQRQEYAQAQEQAKQVEEVVRKASQESSPSGGKAENTVQFTHFLLEKFGGWALDPVKVNRLQQLAQKITAASAGGDSTALDAACNELDMEIQTLPELVITLLNVRGAIVNRVRQHDPAAASRMIQELDQVEEAFKARNPRANSMLDQLAQKLIGLLQPAKEDKCHCGHVWALGEMTCPKCKLSRHLLVGDGGKSAGLGFSSI